MVPQSDPYEHEPLARLAALPQLITPTPKLLEQLNAWADGAQRLHDAEQKIAAWKQRVMHELANVPVLLADSGSAACEALSRGSDHESSSTNTARSDAKARMTASELTAAARGHLANVNAGCSLMVRLFVSFAEVAGAARMGAAGESERPKDAEDSEDDLAEEGDDVSTDPLHSASLAALAHAASEAVARTASLPLGRACSQSLADAMRLMNAQLECAEARKATHELRRHAAALAHFIVSLRSPLLGRASDAHKVLPLLLRWCEALDAPARAQFLAALRHAAAQLPMSELRWHGQLLSHTLCKMLVFRESCCLRHLLPVLVEAWPQITSENASATAGSPLAPADSSGGGAALEAMHRQLLDAVANELLYVAPYATSRRLHLRHLRHLAPHLGLRLALKLSELLSGVCMILESELLALGSAVRRRKGSAPQAGQAGQRIARDEAGARRAVRNALLLLAALLREVWPRAAAHAPLVARHAIAAYLRVAMLADAATSRDGSDAPSGSAGATDADRILPAADAMSAAVDLLKLLQAAGAASVCAAALCSARKRTSGGPLQAAVASLSERILQPEEVL